MALAISGIPMLTGDEALAFREKAEETLKKRGSIDFSKQRAEMKAILAKAKIQLQARHYLKKKEDKGSRRSTHVLSQAQQL